MITQALQLTIRFGASTPPVLQKIAPDGARSAFSLPKKMAYVLTDITIFGPTSGLVAVAIGQGSGTTGSVWWEYRAPSLPVNYERSFTTGLVLTKKFEVIGVTLPGEEITVLISGYLRRGK